MLKENMRSNKLEKHKQKGRKNNQNEKLRENEDKRT
jgi:hypothetical protein